MNDANNNTAKCRNSNHQQFTNRMYIRKSKKTNEAMTKAMKVLKLITKEAPKIYKPFNSILNRTQNSIREKEKDSKETDRPETATNMEKIN